MTGKVVSPAPGQRDSVAADLLTQVNMPVQDIPEFLSFVGETGDDPVSLNPTGPVCEVEYQAGSAMEPVSGMWKQSTTHDHRAKISDVMPAVNYMTGRVTYSAGSSHELGVVKGMDGTVRAGGTISRKTQNTTTGQHPGYDHTAKTMRRYRDYANRCTQAVSAPPESHQGEVLDSHTVSTHVHPLPVLQRAASRRVRQRPVSSLSAAARLCAAGAVLALVPGCSAAEGSLAGAGPLDFPEGLTAMMYPMKTGSFYVVGACAKQEAVSVRIVDVEPVELSGADRVSFKVGWPTPQRPNKFGSAPIRRLPDLFEAAEGSSGTAKSCDDPPSSLQIATVFPPAVNRDVVVDGIEVTYATAGRRYTGTADVRLGVCASEPAGEPSERCP